MEKIADKREKKIQNFEEEKQLVEQMKKETLELN